MIGFADFEAFLKASFPDMTDGMVAVSYTHLRAHET